MNDRSQNLDLQPEKKELRDKKKMGKKGKKGKKEQKKQDEREKKQAKKLRKEQKKAAKQDEVFYPPIEPYNFGFLKVSELHTLYFEESGNKKGKPVIFVHGGPGGGTDPAHRRYFDPKIYRIILLDQRGCGKSKPKACLEENNTANLIADMETLRNHLGIKKWLVFGGSWGCLLALVYAQAHAKKVTGLILRGVFLGGQSEIDWLYQRGASAVFPDAWEGFVKPIPVNERHEMVQAYQRLFNGADKSLALQAAKAWSLWEGRTSKHTPDPASEAKYEVDDFAVAFANIELHFFVNNCWLRPNQILEDINKIAHIPTIIVQGRYDMVCPMESAWALHRAFPEAEFVIVPDGGHSSFDPGIKRALVAATDKFGAR